MCSREEPKGRGLIFIYHEWWEDDAEGSSRVLPEKRRIIYTRELALGASLHALMSPVWIWQSSKPGCIERRDRR